MSTAEPTYTFTITDAERAALAYSLALLVGKLTNAKLQIESPDGGTQVARGILSPPAAAPAKPQAAPIEQRDRWARDRKGNEVPNPKGSTAREVTIWKTEQKPKFLKVTWQSQERGYIDANCFDQQLWPWLIKQTGQKTTLHLVRKGDYLNVVGVRA
jgi:hypothetical protein